MTGIRCVDVARRGVASIGWGGGNGALRAGKREWTQDGGRPVFIPHDCGFQMVLTESMTHLGCIWESLN